jgi:hypothetical protein
MTDALTQLRDALERPSMLLTEHALVPRTLLRELLARLEAAEAWADAQSHHSIVGQMDTSAALRFGVASLDTVTGEGE